MDPFAQIYIPDPSTLSPPGAPPPVPFPDVGEMPSIAYKLPLSQGHAPVPPPDDDADVGEWMKYSRRPRHLDVLETEFSGVVAGLTGGRKDKSEWVKTKEMTAEEVIAHKKRLSRDASAMTLKRKVAESNFLLDVTTNNYLEARAIDDMVSRVFCQNVKMAADLQEERTKRRKLEVDVAEKMDEMNKKLDMLVEIANVTKKRREARSSRKSQEFNDDLRLDLEIGLGLDLSRNSI